MGYIIKLELIAGRATGDNFLVIFFQKCFHLFLNLKSQGRCPWL